MFETEGINFHGIHERLRYEYYVRWMANPSLIDADSRMPKYGNEKGRTQLVEVLDGNADAQFEAIWKYLQSSSR